jgi:inosose dehydratase
VSSTITIGTAPDSWGVWFPSDPEQVPPEVFLREVAEAGYQWIELGPYGYLPTDPAKLSEQLDEYGMGVLAGTVFEHLHRPDSWDAVWRQVTDVAALTQALGGKHIVVIPEVWRHHKTGEPVENRELSSEQWKQKTSGLDELGRRILEEYGLHVQFHSHADSHVGYQPDIERLLESTDPEWVNLCFDTGHIAYYGGDCLELIAKYPDRCWTRTSPFPKPYGWAPWLSHRSVFRTCRRYWRRWRPWTETSRASSSTTSIHARRISRCPSPRGRRPISAPAVE